MSTPRFLCPIDFCEPARTALQQADFFAQLQGASLTLLHVHPVLEVGRADFSYVRPPAQLDELHHCLVSRLHTWALKLATPTHQVHFEVAMGTPAKEIVAYSHDFDLVIMGTHGRSGMGHFLLGSVAERVVQGSHCSVLIAKSSQPST